MDGDPKVLLEVWKAWLNLSQEVLGTRGRRSWSKSRFGSTLLERKPMRYHRLLVDRLFNEIGKEKDFIHKKGITKKKADHP
jgi:hypothetical protein